MNEPAQTAPERSDRSNLRRYLTGKNIAIAVAALLILVVLWRLLTPATKPAAPPPALQVQTMTVTAKPVPDLIETSGTVIATQTVNVTPQTAGVIQSVLVGDGQDVRKGQLLFVIDPRPLRAVLAQAQATLARDTALAADAADTAQRYGPLAALQAVDKKSYVTAVDTARSLRGTVALDRAAVASARLSLAYTQVRAPISGRAGAVQIKPGNVVTADSTTPLLTINTAAPVEASFALPHVQVDQVRAAAGQQGNLPVVALDSASGKELARGQLYFLDNRFDDSSGTLAVRARFANPGTALWPGQFVTIRVILSQQPVLAVPESALQQGQQGPYVYSYVNGKAVVRQLTVARMVDGQAVVSAGLKPGETVILTVPNELKDGSAVTSTNQRLPAAKSDAPNKA